MPLQSICQQAPHFFGKKLLLFFQLSQKISFGGEPMVKRFQGLGFLHVVGHHLGKITGFSVWKELFWHLFLKTNTKINRISCIRTKDTLMLKTQSSFYYIYAPKNNSDEKKFGHLFLFHFPNNLRPVAISIRVFRV